MWSTQAPAPDSGYFWMAKVPLLPLWMSEVPLILTHVTVMKLGAQKV